MEFVKVLLFLFICFSLVASVLFSVKSFTGYLISDIPDINSNLFAFLFLALGLVASWFYVQKFRTNHQKN